MPNAPLPEDMLPLSTLIRNIAQAMTTCPESVTVDPLVSPDAEKQGLCLRVAPADMVRVVGKDGRTAKSLKTLVAAAGMKVNQRFDLCICEQHAALLPVSIKVDTSKLN